MGRVRLFRLRGWAEEHFPTWYPTSTEFPARWSGRVQDGLRLHRLTPLNSHDEAKTSFLSVLSVFHP